MATAPVSVASRPQHDLSASVVSATTKALSAADVDIHAISVPARAFTGDFFFTHRVGDTLWLAVGDVAGKGLDAALIMAMIQEELEHRITSCSHTGCDPATTMTRLHTFIRPHMPSNRFASAVMATLRDDGQLTVVNAGHTPLLIRRRDGSIETIGSTGPILGMLPQARWKSVHLHLARGESVLAYSDGVVEAMDERGAEFGEDRLRAVFGDAASGSAREIATTVVKAVQTHSGPQRFDDVTVLVAQR